MSFIPDKHTCVVCMKKVLDSEKGLQCDHHCDRWFHAGCVDVTEQEYSKLASDSRRKWRCSRADCILPERHPTSLLLSQMGEILKKLDNLSSVPTDVSSIKNDIAAINLVVSSLEPRISDVENRMEIIEKEVNSLRTCKPESNIVEAVLEESADRTRRAHNVLVHGAPESNSKTVATRIKHDNDIAAKLVDQFLHSEGMHPFKTLRLGGPSSKKPRPLKIIFNNVGDVTELMKNFNNDDLDQTLPDIRISRDRTPTERQLLNDIREELKRRTAAGEVNLTIKYRNGVPKIVSGAPKN